MTAERTPIIAADLFCGAGGSSTGLIKAANALGMKLNLLAVNHWQMAVKTHERNHPWARHLCADLSTVDPSKAIPGGSLDLLIASPECTHHSIARGGKPCSDQSRASAWHVLHWVERLRIKRVLIENVKEFASWGPLHDNGKPDADRKGETFNAFVAALRSLGYTVDWKIINAADYGDATTRRRLFIQAARDGERITWPTPSHAGQWRPAREIIDWSKQGSSIFRRKRPLAPRTMARIEAGLKKYGGEAFIAIMRGTADDQLQRSTRSVECPIPTISAGGTHIALCEPFVIPMEHSGRNAIRSTEDPLPTITTAKGGSFGLCHPFVIGQQSKSASRSVDLPLPTIATKGAIALCQPFLTKYYGSANGARPVDEPLDTITVKDRFALVEPMGMDIYFRMLQPHELAAAMGFDGYEFCGTKTEQVKQIGNAVSVRTAQALCAEILKNNIARRSA